MIELLNSNYQPLKTNGKRFSDRFFDIFVNHASSTKIASGYISEESIADLISLYQTGYNKPLNLIVGMHYFEGFSYGQYYALLHLADILDAKKAGGIYIANVMKYHGKIYSFCENDKYTSIIGSSNLTKISLSKENAPERVYDTDLYISDETITGDIDKFISELQEKLCINIKSLKNENLKIIEPANLFENYLSVEKLLPNDIQIQLTDTVFKIPLKTEEKSNLNVYFGKGRENFADGSVLPRDWYEIELIVPSSTNSKKDYPKNKKFWVITDDGYKFECKTSGNNSKNFRSASDLKILGRWIKGRMENRQVLKTGEKVTEDTIKKFGSNSILLKKTTDPDIWYLDLQVPHKGVK